MGAAAPTGTVRQRQDLNSRTALVYDGQFHCFRCGEHGDAISFVIQSPGVGFSKAIEQLAAADGVIELESP
jgi:DNA primase